MLNPNAADRDVNLPTLAVTNHPFLIGNTNGSNYTLTVKNAGGTTIRVIPAGKFYLFFSDGSQWMYSGSDIYKTVSPAQITASQNDYNPTGAYAADILRINSDAAWNITGLAGGSAGRVKIIHNTGSFTLTLKDESASSTAANRFALSADVELAGDQSVMLVYDETTARWRMMGSIASASTSLVLSATLSADGTWSGITETGTAGAALAFGDLCYFSVTDSRWELADADAAATAFGKLGICILAAAADGDATSMLLYGKVRADTAFPALTIGAPVYVGTTAGDIQTTAPSGAADIIRVVGYGNTADELFFNPSSDWFEHA